MWACGVFAWVSSRWSGSTLPSKHVRFILISPSLWTRVCPWPLQWITAIVAEKQNLNWCNKIMERDNIEMNGSWCLINKLQKRKPVVAAQWLKFVSFKSYNWSVNVCPKVFVWVASECYDTCLSSQFSSPTHQIEDLSWPIASHPHKGLMYL